METEHELLSVEAARKKIVGRQVKIVGNHPWAGHRAKVIGLDDIGMKVSLMRNDALDGHEAYVMKKEHFIAIPKHLETEQ